MLYPRLSSQCVFCAFLPWLGLIPFWIQDHYANKGRQVDCEEHVCSETVDCGRALMPVLKQSVCQLAGLYVFHALLSELAGLVSLSFMQNHTLIYPFRPGASIE